MSNNEAERGGQRPHFSWNWMQEDGSNNKMDKVGRYVLKKHKKTHVWFQIWSSIDFVHFALWTWNCIQLKG